MRVLIVTAGSWGDVAPYTGLAARLRAAGHQVALATHAVFEQAVVSRRIGFRPLPADPRQELASANGQALARGFPGPVTVARVLRMAREFMPRLTDGILDAVHQGTDVLLAATLTDPLCATVAEGLGIHSFGAYLQPVRPTAAFPPPLSGGHSFGPRGNRWAGRMTLAATDRAFAAPVDRVRRDLGLPELRSSGHVGLFHRPERTVLHGFSPHIVRPPPDWPSGHRACGYWWPAEVPGWKPDRRLLDFLEAGPPPVFAGFGSMVAEDAERLSALLVTALRRAGVRGIVQSGWSGLRTDHDDVLTVSEVPHAWLFPRTAAVVHHCGAGTTAAGLRAGVPAVPVPMLLDQHFWAARLTALGVAPPPVRFRRLTVDRLGDAVRAATGDAGYRTRARRLASLLAEEDGAAPVLAALDRIR